MTHQEMAMIDTSVRKDIENTANTAAEQLASKASQYVNLSDINTCETKLAA